MRMVMGQEKVDDVPEQHGEDIFLPDRKYMIVVRQTRIQIPLSL